MCLVYVHCSVYFFCFHTDIIIQRGKQELNHSSYATYRMYINLVFYTTLSLVPLYASDSLKLRPGGDLSESWSPIFFFYLMTSVICLDIQNLLFALKTEWLSNSCWPSWVVMSQGKRCFFPMLCPDVPFIHARMILLYVLLYNSLGTRETQVCVPIHAR